LHSITPTPQTQFKFQSERAEIIALQKAGRSSGFLELIKFPSTTTSASIYSAPALTRSSFIEWKPVAFFPFKIPADIGTQPA
jgi:hypothetical protein